MQTPRLNLPLIAAGQAQKHVPANESFKRLDALVHMAVISMAETDPPGDPSEGDMYVAAAGATGAWSDGDLNMFLFTDGTWLKIPPLEGMTVWDRDQATLFVWDGEGWVAGGLAGGLDIEVGTWTPEFTFGTPGDLSVSYDRQQGAYTRIDNIVDVICDLRWTPTYTTASGTARIPGLPFTIAGEPAFATPGQAVHINTNLGYPEDATTIIAFGVTGQDRIGLNGQGPGVNTGLGPSEMPSGVAQGIIVRLLYFAVME